MRPGSSTSLSRGVALAALLVLAGMTVRAGAVTSFGVCLPPAFDRGERLQEVGAMRLAHLELAFRQHRVCREPLPGAGPRVFLVGNSAVLGHPLPWPQSFAAQLNERFAGGEARIFNLGTLFTYQLKDVMVLEAGLRYRPDLVVWGVTLKDFLPKAPIPEPPGVIEFFAVNSARVRALAEAPPAGMREPLARYAAALEAAPPAPEPWLLLRSAGAYLPLAVRHATRELLERRLLDPADVPPASIDPALLPPPEPDPAWRCGDVEASFREHYGGWSRWSALPWLAQLSRETGLRILVVNLPVVHQAIGRCYNALYPTAAFREYLQWMARETQANGLDYLDLHDLLPASEFLDPLHPSAAGHRRVAEALAPAIAARLRP